MRNAVFLAVLGTVSTHFCSYAAAQANATATGPGAAVVLGGGASIFQSAYGQRDLGGGFVFLDMQPQWRFSMEAEARYLRLHTSEDVTEKNYLVGPRVVVRSGRWQPYAKFLIGDDHIEMPFRYARGDFLALVSGAGVDFALNDYVNVRLVDVEYQLCQDFPYGNLRPYGISAGLSLRLTPLVRFPKGPRFHHGRVHLSAPSG